jgi:hypothetical protein
MNFDNIMKLIGIAGLAVTSLATAGIIPAAFAVVGTIIAGAAGYGHSSPVSAPQQASK